MFSLPRDYERKLVDSCTSEIKSAKVTAINMNDYMDNMLLDNSNKADLHFPLEINIPRDIDYMLRTKDISPLKTITIEKPFEYRGQPIWNKSCTKGIHLGFGYLNGDRRYMSEFSLGNNSPVSGPHLVIGGMTGGGKSVAIDNLLFNAFYAHSPFELEVILIDGKITGAARYANAKGDTHSIPHIKIIGATEDTSYVISVLEMMDNIMMKRMKLFGAQGFDGIVEFRKHTGLTLPRILILVDEYQLQFKNASNKEAEALKLLYDKYCTAGRSAGIHLLLCSQSYMAELKKAVFNNMPLRACLKCTQETSEGIIENGLAARGIPIGEIYVNNMGARSVEETKMFKIPYIDTDHYVEKGKFLEECGNSLAKEFDLSWDLNYYNEDDKLEQHKLDALMTKYCKPNRFVLGSPAFVKKGEIDVVYIEQQFTDLENIGIFSSNKSDLKEFLLTLEANLKGLDFNKTRTLFLVADDSLMVDLNLPKHIMSFDCDRAESDFFKAALLTSYRKNIMLSTDKEIFAGQKYIKEDAEKYLSMYIESSFNGNKEILSELNLQRVSAYFDKINNPVFFKIYTSSTAARPSEKEIWQQACEILRVLLSFSQDYLTKKVDKDNMIVHNIIFVGFDKINGLTRNEKSVFSGSFSDVLFDSYKSKTNFILVSSLPGPLKSYVNALGWMILSNVNENSAKVGIEIPKGVAPELGLVVKPSTGDFMKFKKLLKYDR